MWITNGPDADVYVIYARTDADAGSKGITAFIVERESAGFSRSPKLDKLGMRGSNTCELVFEDCIVPAGQVLGEIGGGVRVLMSGLDYERAVCRVGPLVFCRPALMPYCPMCTNASSSVSRLASFSWFRASSPTCMRAVLASRAYLYAVCDALDRGEQSRKDAAAVILYTAEAATQSALDAIQLLGGNGYINDYPTGRLLRDAKLYEIGAGTSEIRRMLVGRELFSDTA